MARVTLCSAHAFTASSASRASRPSGFSTKTCFPAFAAAMICSQCMECGVASTTASIDFSERRLSYESRRRIPFCSHHCRAFSGVRVVPATNRICSLEPYTLETRLRPQEPMPTMAARIMNILLSPHFERRETAVLEGRLQARSQLGLEILLRHADADAAIGGELGGEAGRRRAGDVRWLRRHDAELGELLVIALVAGAEEHPRREERALGAVAELVDIAMAQRCDAEVREHVLQGVLAELHAGEGQVGGGEVLGARRVHSE